MLRTRLRTRLRVDGSAFSPEVFFIDGFAGVRPSFGTFFDIADTANYPSGEFSFTATATSGSRTITRTGGAPVADAGTGHWGCGVIYANGATEFNSIISGDGAGTFYLAWPAAQSGAITVYGRADSALGQHYSPTARDIFADYVFAQTRRNCWALGNLFTRYADETGVLTPKWTTYSPANPVNLSFNSRANPWNSATYVFGCGGSMVTQAVGNTQVGGGISLTFPISGRNCLLAFECGLSATATITAGAPVYFGRVQVFADAASIYDVAFDHFVLSNRVIVPSGVSNVEIRITRTDSTVAAPAVRVGQVLVSDLTTLRRPTDRVVSLTGVNALYGDSWFDTSTYGARFKSRLEASISGAGGTGSVTSRGVGGAKLGDHLGNFAAWAAADRASMTFLHYGINDKNAAVTNETFWSQMAQAVAAIRASGSSVCIIGSGDVFSSSQVVSLSDLYQFYQVTTAANKLPYA